MKIKEVVRGAIVPQSEHHHYFSQFRYPRHGGFASYVQSFASVQGINFGYELSLIDMKKHELEFTNNKRVQFDVLISSIPIPELVRRIKDVPKDVLDAAVQLSCSSIVLVNVGVERDNIQPDCHWLYVYDEDILPSRISFPHKLSPSNVPDGCGSIQAEVYHSKYRQLPVKDVLNKTIDDMIKMDLLNKNDRIKVAHEQRVQYGNIIFDHARSISLKVVRDYLDKNNIFSCGRFGEWEYYWTDDTIISGWRIAEKIKQHAA